MSALWLIAKPFLPYLIGALLLGGAFAAYKARVAYAHHEGVTDGRAEIQAKWDADAKRREQMVTNLALQWDRQRLRGDELARQQEQSRTASFVAIETRARSLPPVVAGIRIPVLAASVLDDAIRASALTQATGEPAKDPAQSAAAAASESNVGLLVEWGVTVVKMYRACVDTVVGWQGFYAGVQNAKGTQ